MGSSRWFGLTAVTLVSGVVATFSGACGGLYGEEVEPGAGDAAPPIETGASSSGDVGASLNCPIGCMAPPPSGWTGPSAVYDGADDTKPAECPPLYPQKQLEGRDGVDAGGPASCACGTGAPQGGKCKLVISHHTETKCSFPGNFSTDVPPATCIDRANFASALFVGTPTLVPPACAFPQAVLTTAPLTFERAVVACGLPQNVACAERSECVASPVASDPFTRMCVHRVGDQPCESANYPARFTVFANVRDGRACACYAAPISPSCGANVDFYSGPKCTGTKTSLPVGTCNTSDLSVDLSPIGPFASGCEVAEQSSVIGEVALVDVTTFCCNK